MIGLFMSEADEEIVLCFFVQQGQNKIWLSNLSIINGDLVEEILPSKMNAKIVSSGDRFV